MSEYVFKSVTVKAGERVTIPDDAVHESITYISNGTGKNELEVEYLLPVDD